MPDYRKMYFFMFNAITDALEALKQQNFGAAVDILKAAQQNGEAKYVEGEEAETEPCDQE